MLFVVCSSLLMVFISYRVSYTEIIQREVDKGETFAQLLRSAVEHEVLEVSEKTEFNARVNEHLQLLIQDVADRSTLENIVVGGVENHRWASSGKPFAQGPPDVARLAMSSGGSVHRFDRSQFRLRFATPFWRTLQPGDIREVAGYVYFETSLTSSLDGLIMQSLIKAGLAISVPLVLLSIIGAAFYRAVLKPVNHLAWQAELLGRGDFSVRSGLSDAGGKGDDIERLASAFDTMAARIQTSNRQLLESKEKLSAIFEALPDVGFLLDRDCVYIDVMSGHDELLAVPAENLLGNKVTKVIPGQVGKDIESHIRKSFETGETMVYEYPLAIKGEQLWFEGRCSVIEREGGRYELCIWIAREITERIKTQQELERAKEAAEAADKAKSDFLAMMSHEIRTPLNSVLGFSNLLLETELDDEQKDYLRTVASSGKTLLGVINDILDFSKIEAGKLELEEEYFHPVDSLEEVLAMFERDASSKKLRLEYHVAEDIPEELYGSVSRIKQILINLLGNAVKFTHEGGITVNLHGEDVETPEATGDYNLFFSVKDTGIGISEEKTRLLFQPFVQEDSSTSRQYGGTGLGLAICRRLCELMNGEIKVISAKGEGSEFSFRVTVSKVREMKKVTDQFSTIATDIDNRHLKVLVVEDNEANAKLTVSHLKNRNCETTCVGDGRACLQAVHQHPYDIILMDAEMPFLSGIDATRKLREGVAGEHTRDIPIIIITATTSEEVRHACLEAGANKILTKPVDYNELFVAIENALDPVAK